jgi:hypothetical protein
VVDTDVDVLVHVVVTTSPAEADKARSAKVAVKDRACIAVNEGERRNDGGIVNFTAL